MLNKSIVEEVVAVSREYGRSIFEVRNDLNTQTKSFMSEFICDALKTDLATAYVTEKVEVISYKNKTYLKIHSEVGGTVKYVEITTTVKEREFDLEKEMEVDRQIQALNKQMEEMRIERNRAMARYREELRTIGKRKDLIRADRASKKSAKSKNRGY